MGTTSKCRDQIGRIGIISIGILDACGMTLVYLRRAERAKQATQGTKQKQLSTQATKTNLSADLVADAGHNQQVADSAMASMTKKGIDILIFLAQSA